MFAVAALGAALTGAASGAGAAEPPTAPILRIETTMHVALVRRIVVDPRHNRLVSAGDDKTIRIWQLPQGRLARVLRIPIGAGYEGRIYGLAVSPDGRTIAAGGWTGWEWDRQGAVYLFDAETGRLLQRIGGFADVIGALAFAKDGRHLAVGLHGEGGLSILRTSDYARVAHDGEYRDKILGADFRADGALAVAALDGQVRLYDADFRLLGRKRVAPGAKPLTVRFSPDGRELAVSFHDVAALAVLRASDLSTVLVPDTARLRHHARLTEVAWSDDGATLYGCGDYAGPGASPILRWRDRGRGPMESLPATRARIADLQPVPGGGVAFAAEDPAIGVLDPAGARVLFRGPELADFASADPLLRVSRDAARVQFGLGGEPVRFSLFARELLRGAAAGAELAGALAESPQFAFVGPPGAAVPSLNGVRLELDDYELVRARAVDPAHERFLLGTEWALRAYDRDAALLWRTEVPGVVRSVVVAPNGQTAVATLADGTVRWYRMEDGAEFLALFPHADGEEWIAWNRDGYYVSSNLGDGYVGWHINRGRDRDADFYRAVQFERVLFRPDLVDESFRRRGRPGAETARRAVARFDVSQLDAISPPRVSLTTAGVPRAAPDGGFTARLRIVGEQTAIPMLEHAVLVNNVPITPATRRALADDERRAFSRELTVNLAPGENRVRVEVSNGTSLGYAEAVVDVAAARTAPPPAGDLYVLAIGVDEFPGLKDANLAYAARDAEELARLFRDEGGRRFRRVFVRTLSDLGPEKPDRAAILEALDFAADASGDDTVVAFLASHGVSDAGGEYWFVPRDAQADDLTRVLHASGVDAPSLIRSSVLVERLRRVAGRRILIVDTCHARGIEGGPGLQTLGKRSATSAVSLLVAAKGSEESQEYPPARHGLFTHALLEGLRGAADTDRDGVVTLAEAFRYAVPVVERLRDRAAGPQTPQLFAPEPLGATVLLGRAATAMAAGE